MSKLKTLDDLKKFRESLRAQRNKVATTVTISGGTCGIASGSMNVLEAIHRELTSKKLDEAVRVRMTGCHGFCEQEPVMVIDPGNIFYCQVSPDDIEEIVDMTIKQSKVIDRLLYTDPTTKKKIVQEIDIPFYRAQDRALLGQNRYIDPGSITDYIAIGGYAAMDKILTSKKPDSVIEEIKASGLRGRGGGGFPTGKKWEQCRAAKAEEKYVICNADEGDPGAYMDRSLLEGNPHSVIEGMIIGSCAIGSTKGYIYVRNEYPLAVEHARIALKQAKEYGLLGNNILGSGHSFDIEIIRGAGAFVCGESTALMLSLEGKVGEPRPKDVHTVEQGLWDKPTNLNNVETWANVPLIINNGAKWFNTKGVPSSTGTKIFALTGQVKNTGLVEVAMGTPLKTLIYDIGGGQKGNVPIKAVQTGGPSGGCLPASEFDLSVDFDTLYEAGSMVGSGGMVVMDERTCMVDVAKYFLTFLQDESCGKCTPCRIGVSRMLEIVTDITEGRGTYDQLALLEELAETIAETSLCALGKTAPNPVLSTLKYFRDEYICHIEEKKCSAGVCRVLIQYNIEPEICTGCDACLKACPNEAITGEKKQSHNINQDICVKCGICSDVCKFDAVGVS